MNTFGTNLRRLRLNRKLTQDQLALLLKVSKSRISMYENGNREPSFEMLETIADFFNVDMNSLIQNEAEVHLSPSESSLISNYRKLNEEGQEKLLEYSEDLLASGRYIKSDEDSLVEEKT